MVIEYWKPVFGFEGFYSVSNYGRIFSHITNKILKDRIDKKGYNNVCLKGRKFFKVSHIVARSFPEICGEWFEGAEVDHLNGVRNDNRPENLKICTHTENIRNPLTIERFKKREKHPHPKQITINGITFNSQREAAKYYGVKEGYISAYKKGRIQNPKLLV